MNIKPCHNSTGKEELYIYKSYRKLVINGLFRVIYAFENNIDYSRKDYLVFGCPIDCLPVPSLGGSM